MTEKEMTTEVLSDPTRKLMTRVLNEFVSCGVIGIAFDKCDIPRRLHRVWKEVYPEYKEMFDTMNERFVDGLEQVAIERAMEKSDTLMILMLKANRPEKYNQSVDVNMTANSGVQFVFPRGMLSEAEERLLSGGSNEE